MKTVNHPFILKLYEVVTTPKPAKGVLLVIELFDATVIYSNANQISEHTMKANFNQIPHCTVCAILLR